MFPELLTGFRSDDGRMRSSQQSIDDDTDFSKRKRLLSRNRCGNLKSMRKFDERNPSSAVSFTRNGFDTRPTVK